MGSIRYQLTLLTHYIIMFLAWIASYICRWFFNGAHRGLPAANDPILMMRATELAKKIRKRELTSVEVVTSFISRIRQVNPYINAVVANRFEEALKEAEEVDRLLDGDNLPDKLSEVNAPFLGVPVTTKEALSVAGLPNTSGLLVRRGVRSERDSDAIALMRKAGAIPLAVTNVSELCMWCESSNFIYGCTRNAYHQGRMVGGSSGGEGCIQSAAASAMGIGSDIGGSIRMPCFFSGIFGHKCTTGAVSSAGQFPFAKGEALSFLSTGPMCRYATDLLPIFKLLVLPEVKDRLKLNDQVDIHKLKFFYMEDDGGGLLLTPVQPAIKAAVRKAANYFESLGCAVERVALRQFKQSFAIWSSLMATSGNDTFCSLLAGGPPDSINPYYELLLWIIGFRRHTLPAIGLGVGEKMFETPEKVTPFHQLRDSLLRDLENLLGDDGVFLYPPHPRPAPFHHETLITFCNFAYTGIFNVLGVPVTAVPMGIAPDEEVPIGIQVAASRFNDRLPLAVAVELERAFGGWVPPFEVDE